MISPTESFDPNQLMQAVGELQKNTAANQARRENRIAADCKAWIVQGSVSQRDGKVMESHCHDISTSGCRIIASKALMVGDLFLIKFENKSLQIDTTFCRCVRCIFLREDKFELGFSFLQPVNLNTGSNQNESESLI